MDDFWSLLKRGLNGAYVSVKSFYLFRYVDKQAFRLNNRNEMKDADRFDLAIRRAIYKRLTWKELTGEDIGPEAI